MTRTMRSGITAPIQQEELSTEVPEVDVDQIALPGMVEAELNNKINMTPVPREDLTHEEDKSENDENRKSLETPSSDKKRTWGDVVILEALIIQHPVTNEKIEVFHLVEESCIPGRSTAEAEQWLTEQIQSEHGSVCAGKFMIVRKVKTLQLKEEIIRRVLISEIDD